MIEENKPNTPKSSEDEKKSSLPSMSFIRAFRFNQLSKELQNKTTESSGKESTIIESSVKETPSLPESNEFFPPQKEQKETNEESPPNQLEEVTSMESSFPSPPEKIPENIVESPPQQSPNETLSEPSSHTENTAKNTEETINNIANETIDSASARSNTEEQSNPAPTTETEEPKTFHSEAPSPALEEKIPEESTSSLPSEEQIPISSEISSSSETSEKTETTTEKTETTAETTETTTEKPSTIEETAEDIPEISPSVSEASSEKIETVAFQPHPEENLPPPEEDIPTEDETESIEETKPVEETKSVDESSILPEKNVSEEKESFLSEETVQAVEKRVASEMKDAREKIIAAEKEAEGSVEIEDKAIAAEKIAQEAKTAEAKKVAELAIANLKENLKQIQEEKTIAKETLTTDGAKLAAEKTIAEARAKLEEEKAQKIQQEELKKKNLPDNLLQEPLPIPKSNQETLTWEEVEAQEIESTITPVPILEEDAGVTRVADFSDESESTRAIDYSDDENSTRVADYSDSGEDLTRVADGDNAVVKPLLDQDTSNTLLTPQEILKMRDRFEFEVDSLIDISKKRTRPILEMETLEGETLLEQTLLKIDAKIAEGGMGSIYRAKMIFADGVEKIVALKTLKPQYTHNPELLSMFINEARLMAELTHHNIVTLLTFGKFEGLYFYAMEYVEGRDLNEFRARHKKLGRATPIGVLCYIVAQVCAALDYIHNKKDNRGKPLELIHRDISPHNIMFSKDGVVKLMDFGVAKGKSIAKSESKPFAGKLNYIAPEMALSKEVDHRSDLYSLGVVFYEVLTSQVPLRWRNHVELIFGIEKAEMKPPREIRADIPEEIEIIIMKALAKSPNERWGDASAMGFALGHFLYSKNLRFNERTLSAYLKGVFVNLAQAGIETSKQEDLVDMALAQAAIKQGLVKPEHLMENLREQAEYVSRGEFMNLGALLVQNNLLTNEQFLELLKEQLLTIMRCPSCSNQYYVKIAKTNRLNRCLRCRNPLEIPKVLNSALVDGKL